MTPVLLARRPDLPLLRDETLRSAAKRILIVEDNELNMKLLHDVLEAHGYITITASEGAAAIALARAHRPDVGAPHIRRCHLRDGNGSGVQRRGEMRSEEVDGGHEHEPEEDASGEHDGGDARADDVADAEVLGGAVGADAAAFEQMLRADVEVFGGGCGPEAEEVVVLEKRVEAAEAESEEDTGGEAAAALSGDENVGAGGAFGVDEGAVLFDDELAAEGNHEEHA